MTDSANAGLIHVEVAYARPEKQLIVALDVPVGTTAAAAAALSKIDEYFESLDLSDADYGIFSRRVTPDHVLASGDRVEIYRPLTADPKEVRRQLAKLGKTMGRG